MNTTIDRTKVKRSFPKALAVRHWSSWWVYSAPWEYPDRKVLASWEETQAKAWKAAAKSTEL